MTGVFSERLKQQLPAPRDTEGAARFWNDLAPDQQALLQNHRKFLEAVAGGSPYLRALMLRDPLFLSDLLSHAPEDLLKSLCASLHAAQTLTAQVEIMAVLRHAKARASLLIALADLGEVWSVDEVTAALTRFAEAMLGAAVNWLLLDATRAGKFRCIDEKDPAPLRLRGARHGQARRS